MDQLQPSIKKRSIFSKIYKGLRRYFTDKEVFEAEEQLEQHGFRRKSSIKELAVIALILGIVSLVIWIVVSTFNLQPVPWSQAFTAVLSLAIAIIAYRQWKAARHEISIDKYYDRLEVANKRLEAVQTDKLSPEDMHVFAELDKLEYVIAKYEYGFMSPLLALRALNNFKGLWMDRRGFRGKASHWVDKASYREITRLVVRKVCEHCWPSNSP
jgi:hypothetical protein